MKNDMMSYGINVVRVRVVKFGIILVDIVFLVFIDVVKWVLKLFIEVLNVLVVMGIVLDLWFLILSLIDLFKFNKGLLCDEVEKF